MNEFSLINAFFRSIKHHRKDVILGIGDDAAWLAIPPNTDLLVSCDTLVAGVHFLDSWDAYDIASKAVRVNVSDMAAMAATPAWLTLALTLPSVDEQWLARFSKGLEETLNQYTIALIGGDTTRGPLSITMTIHGLTPKGSAIRRSGARPGDRIYVSGSLGAAALAVAFLDRVDIPASDQESLMKSLLYPNPRVDLVPILREFSNAAIDISDGLSADLNHLCEASQGGACLMLDQIPLHPLVQKYKGTEALDFALSGGDDYELCFTISPEREAAFLESLKKAGLNGYAIGVIEEQAGLRAKTKAGDLLNLMPKGYSHFL